MSSGICTSKIFFKYLPAEYAMQIKLLSLEDTIQKKRYTKRMWNKDKEPKEVDVYWKDLTPEQQAGAIVLGWSKWLVVLSALLLCRSFG